MKKILVLLSFATISMSFADEISIPTKCLYNSADGTTLKEKSCLSLRSKSVNKEAGVCMFVQDQKTWQRGVWSNPKGSKPGNFQGKQVCDRGIEYITTDTDSMPQGPMAYDNSKEVKYENHKFISSYHQIKGEHQVINEADGKIPSVCFLNRNKTTGLSSDSKPCDVDPQKNGFCALRDLNNYPKKKKHVKDQFDGLFWVRYTDTAKPSFEICKGGVTLRDAEANDPIIKKIKVLTLPIANIMDQDPKFCITKEDSKNDSDILICSNNEKEKGSCIKTLNNNHEAAYIKRRKEIKDDSALSTVQEEAKLEALDVKFDMKRYYVINGKKINGRFKKIRCKLMIIAEQRVDDNAVEEELVDNTVVP